MADDDSQPTLPRGLITPQTGNRIRNPNPLFTTPRPFNSLILASAATTTTVGPPTSTVVTQTPPSSTDTSRYAFISHSPTSYVISRPSIDNAQLARRRRRRTSPRELAVLEHEYNTTDKPDKKSREMIAHTVGMSEKAVQIWFQNRRAHERNRIRRAREHAVSLSIMSTQPPQPSMYSMLQYTTTPTRLPPQSQQQLPLRMPPASRMLPPALETRPRRGLMPASDTVLSPSPTRTRTTIPPIYNVLTPGNNSPDNNKLPSIRPDI